MECMRALELDGLVESLKPVADVRTPSEDEYDSDGDIIRKRRRGESDDSEGEDAERRQFQAREKIRERLKERKRRERRKRSTSSEGRLGPWKMRTEPQVAGRIAGVIGEDPRGRWVPFERACTSLKVSRSSKASRTTPLALIPTSCER